MTRFPAGVADSRTCKKLSLTYKDIVKLVNSDDKSGYFSGSPVLGIYFIGLTE